MSSLFLTQTFSLIGKVLNSTHSCHWRCIAFLPHPCRSPCVRTRLRHRYACPTPYPTVNKRVTQICHALSVTWVLKLRINERFNWSTKWRTQSKFPATWLVAISEWHCFCVLSAFLAPPHEAVQDALCHRRTPLMSPYGTPWRVSGALAHQS
jgi:hypothetical protein